MEMRHSLCQARTLTFVSLASSWLAIRSVSLTSSDEIFWVACAWPEGRSVAADGRTRSGSEPLVFSIVIAPPNSKFNPAPTNCPVFLAEFLGA